jgi:hypothetical protein
MKDTEKILAKIDSFLPYLNEQQKRIYLALEAESLGVGGKHLLERHTGVSHNTINKGMAELSVPHPVKRQRLRKAGGGRKKKITSGVWEHIRVFIEPHTRGEPESPPAMGK